MAIALPSTVPFSQLLSRSLQVRNETVYDANTAQRIGQLFWDIVQKMQVGTQSPIVWDEQYAGNERMLFEDLQDIDINVQRAINDTEEAMTAFTGLQNDVNDLQQRTTQIENDLIQLEEKVENIRTDVFNVATNLQTLESNVVTQQHIEAVETMIDEIETTLVSLKSRTEQLENKVDIIINP